MRAESTLCPTLVVAESLAVWPSQHQGSHRRWQQDRPCADTRSADWWWVVMLTWWRTRFSEARRIASSHDCKYVEVSASLNHNVDNLLVRLSCLYKNNFLDNRIMLLILFTKIVCNNLISGLVKVGIVKQIRLKMCCGARTAKATSTKQGFHLNRWTDHFESLLMAEVSVH